MRSSGDASRPLILSYHPSRRTAGEQDLDKKDAKCAKKVGFDLVAGLGSERGVTGLVDRDRDTIRTQFTFQQAVPPGRGSSSKRPAGEYSTSFLRHMECQVPSDAPLSLPTNASTDLDDALSLRHRVYYPDYSECLLIADWLAFLGVQGKVVLPVPVPAKSVHTLGAVGVNGNASRNNSSSGGNHGGKRLPSTPTCGPSLGSTQHSSEAFTRCAEEWQNGVLFSECAANLLRQNRAIIKPVEVFDRHGRRSARPRLMLCSTEPLPKSSATSLKNFATAVEVLQREVPVLLNDFLLGDLEGIDVVRGGGGMQWAVLHRLFVTLARVTDGSAAAASAHAAAITGASPSPPRGRTQERPYTAPAAAAKDADTGSPKRAHQPVPHGVASLIRESTAGALPRLSAGGRIGSGGGLEHLGLHWAVSTGRSRSMPVLVSTRTSAQGQRQGQGPATPGPASALAAAGLQPSPILSQSPRPDSLASFHDFHSRHFSPHPALAPLRARSLSPGRRAPFFVSATPISGCGSSSRVDVARAEGLMHRRSARLHGAKLRHAASGRDGKRNLQRAGGDVRNRDVEREPSGEEKGGEVGDMRHKCKTGDGKARLYDDTIHRKRAPSSAPAKRSGYLDWSPPAGDPVLLAACQDVVVAAPTAAQVAAVHNWFNSLGLGILEGEGGTAVGSDKGSAKRSAYPSHLTHSTRGTRSSTGLVSPSPGRPYKSPLRAHEAPVLSLLTDRLRNGTLLCALLYMLEPQACLHAHLYPTLHKAPTTLVASAENLRKCLWILRLRRCPPIPIHYLAQVDRILQGDSAFIFAMLWEVMQAYPHVGAARAYSYTSAQGGGGGASVNLAASHAFNVQTEAMQGGVGPYTQLPYTRGPTGARQNKASISSSGSSCGGVSRSSIDAALGRGSLATATPGRPAPMAAPRGVLLYSAHQRRLLDASLVQWLHSLGLLRQPLGQLALPSTVLALESVVRDGTLLCALVEGCFRLPVAPYNQQPHSWQQCLSNAKKATAALRSLQGVGFSRRMLYQGVEEEIVRGNWDAVLGLLEDCHRFIDRVPGWDGRTMSDGIRRQIYPLSVEGGGAARADASRSSRDAVDGPYLGAYGACAPSAQTGGGGGYGILVPNSTGAAVSAVAIDMGRSVDFSNMSNMVSASGRYGSSGSNVVLTGAAGVRPPAQLQGQHDDALGTAALDLAGSRVALGARRYGDSDLNTSVGSYFPEDSLDG